MLSSFNIKEFISAFIVLFAIIDAIGALPVLVKLSNKGKKIHPKRAAFLSLLMFLMFFYIGEAFLRLFGLDISTFAVAGSFVIFIIALEMILNKEIFNDSAETVNDATFMPVVFPMLAGSGVLTTLLSIRAQYESLNILLALIANVAVIYIILIFAKKLEKIISPSILMMMQRLFGVVLLAIAIKIFVTNFDVVLSSLSNT